MHYRSCLTSLLLILLTACTRNSNVETATYFWKTSVSWSKADTVLIKEINPQKWYVRFFDVDLVGGEPRPVAPVNHPERIPHNRPIVPVVYVTLESLQSLNDSTSALLAKKLVAMVQRMQKLTGRPMTELQIDCDWTVSTKDRYFSFLNAIRTEFDGTLSATIRLHQVKYITKCGTPPVDRGMLMFYNMGHPGKTGDRNAIIDNRIIDSYTKNLKNYPIPLDYAFPIFSWGVLLRDRQMVGLMRDITREQLDSCSFLRQTKPVLWEAIRSGRIGSVVIKRGDRIRLDCSEPTEVLRAARKAAERGDQSVQRTISFFSWNTDQIEQFHQNNIVRLYETFQ